METIEKILPPKNEYTVTVEDIQLRLLINKDKGENLKDFPLLTPHSHLHTEIFACIENEISIQTNNSVITLLKGDIAIIPAEVPHFKIDCPDYSNWVSVGFLITKKSRHAYANLFKKLAPIHTNKKPMVFRNLPEICNRIFQLNSLFDQADEFLPAMELLCILSRLTVIKTESQTVPTEPATRMPDIYRMSWLEDLIENRFYEPLTTSKVAQMLHISTRQLSRIIKGRYNMTFHKLLVQKRLNYAIELLLATENPVNAIIKKVGYTKSSSFYKDFSAQFGMTPTEYRNNF